MNTSKDLLRKIAVLSKWGKLSIQFIDEYLVSLKCGSKEYGSCDDSLAIAVLDVYSQYLHDYSMKGK